MNQKQYIAFNGVLKTMMSYFRIFVFCALGLIAISGVYRVESNEVAVVLRFGRLVGDTPERQIQSPGLHFAFPFIVDEVVKVPVGKILELSVDTHCGSGAAISANFKTNGYAVTGDSNVVMIKTKVKYTVSDPVAYALFRNDQENTINGVVSGEITSLAAGMDVDAVLTSGKAALSEQTMARAQALLNALELGVSLTNVEFTSVTPPADTKSRFEAVTMAAVQKETAIQSAREQASVTKLEAEAKAKTLVQEARANQSANLIRAYNEMAEFDGFYAQYVKNPDVVINSSFRQRVAALLTRMGATIVTPQAGESPVVILP